MAADENTLLDQIEQAVFVLEPDSAGIPRYVAFNAHARADAQRREDEVLGRTVKDLFPGAESARIYQHHLRVLRTATALSYQCQLRQRGRLRQIQVTLRPVLSRDGQVRRIVGTTKDIACRAAQEHRAPVCQLRGVGQRPRAELPISATAGQT